MAKLSLILSLCFLLLRSCLALQSHQPQQNECQFDRLESLQPDNLIKSEAGQIETWNPNHKQFRCAGVALSRYTLERNALRLPSYSNAPQLFFIRRGSGQFGIVFPGCPETFEEPQESESQSEKSKSQDRHQKIRQFREDDVIAVPSGTAFWIYNNGETTVEVVSIIYTASRHNKLDEFPRRFYLAGNQHQEFLQYQKEQQQQQEGGGQGQSQGQQQQEGRQSRPEVREREREQEQEQEGNANNVFSGFGVDFLAQAFNVDKEVARSLQGHQQQSQGSIVRVKGDLSIITPPLRTRSQSDNALEETLCTMRLHLNIGKSTSPDIYNPQAGSLRTVNSIDLPVLKWFGLSAEFGSLHRDALFVPHYNLNANSIIYALQGRARVQIVDCSGKRVFDGEMEEGQALTVPQNYAVAARSQSEHFLYVTFKTNEKAMMATLAGRTSVIRAWPVDVVAQSYQIKTEQARQVKYNNLFSFLVPPQQSRAEMRAAA